MTPQRNNFNYRGTRLGNIGLSTESGLLSEGGEDSRQEARDVQLRQGELLAERVLDDEIHFVDELHLVGAVDVRLLKKQLADLLKQSDSNF